MVTRSEKLTETQLKLALRIASSRVSRMLCKKGNFVRMNWQF